MVSTKAPTKVPNSLTRNSTHPLPKMNLNKAYRGVVVPMVTPIAPDGLVDIPAARRIIEHLLDGGVDGVFVLGTTGEGASVPRSEALRLVELTAQQVRGRALVFSGLYENCLLEAVNTGNQYLRAGADVLVLLPSFYFTLQPSETLSSIASVLDRLAGPVFLYNIPAISHCSIPLDIVEQLLGHPRLVGMKDSENDALRLGQLVTRLSKRPDFSVFIGVGAHMAKMLSLGADGIVPSVGNLVPEVCVELADAIRQGDSSRAVLLEERMMATANLYQRGRSLGGSLAALKAAMNSLGLCGPDVLPPLLTLPDDERKRVRQEMVRSGIWNGRLDTVPASTSLVSEGSAV